MTVHQERYDHVMAGMSALGEDLPEHMTAFSGLHHAVASDGAMSPKDKELVALGIAIAVHCSGCISCHVHDALDMGASRGEVLETIGVAILMGGGPSVVYGNEAREALAEFVSVPMVASAT